MSGGRRAAKSADGTEALPNDRGVGAGHGNGNGQSSTAATLRSPQSPRSPRGVGVAVVRAALDNSVQKLLAADPVARIGTDPEGVHQARVATRRLRSDLRTFAPLLDPLWVATLRDELRWLASELGVAREAEVLLGHLLDRAHALPPELETEVRPLLEAAFGDREAAHVRVLGALRSARYLDLVDRLVQGAIAPRFAPEAVKTSTRDVARLARKPWKQLQRDHAALGTDPSDPALHALRIRAKRARYAVEAVAGAVGGEKPLRLADAITEVQDVLGAHQDAVVAQTWLHQHLMTLDAGTDGGVGAPTIYAAGVLAGLLRADAIAATEALPEVWRRASRRNLRAWM
jgi:CHAD domain-containing protein